MAVDMKCTFRKIKQGWLNQATRKASPNKNNRPDSNNISLIVIHNISLPPNTFGGNWIDDFFLNKLDTDYHPYFKEIDGINVSSHLLIRRDGSITQFVPFHERAWHAGQSNYNGTDNCNDFSIGIELEGADHIPYTEEQYTALAAACKTLINTYPSLTDKSITGHCDIAPERKTDPGDSFEWATFKALL